MALTDKEFNSGRKRIRAVIRKFNSIGIGWWHLDVGFARSVDEMPETGNKQHNDGRWLCAATTSVAWEYRDAKITFNVEAVKDADDETLEKRFLHEYAHMLVNEMRSIAKPDSLTDNWIEHEEHVCTSLANTLHWTYLAGRDSARLQKKRKH